MRVRIVQDEEFAKTMLQAVMDNDGYCPCKLDKNPDTVCMCKEFREFVDSGNTGVCHCGLYEAYQPSSEGIDMDSK